MKEILELYPREEEEQQDRYTLADYTNDYVATQDIFWTFIQVITRSEQEDLGEYPGIRACPKCRTDRHYEHECLDQKIIPHSNYTYQQSANTAWRAWKENTDGIRTTFPTITRVVMQILMQRIQTSINYFLQARPTRNTLMILQNWVTLRDMAWAADLGAIFNVTIKEWKMCTAADLWGISEVAKSRQPTPGREAVIFRTEEEWDAHQWTPSPRPFTGELVNQDIPTTPRTTVNTNLALLDYLHTVMQRIRNGMEEMADPRIEQPPTPADIGAYPYPRTREDTCMIQEPQHPATRIHVTAERNWQKWKQAWAQEYETNFRVESYIMQVILPFIQTTLRDWTLNMDTSLTTMEMIQTMRKLEQMAIRMMGQDYIRWKDNTMDRDTFNEMHEIHSSREAAMERRRNVTRATRQAREHIQRLPLEGGFALACKDLYATLVDLRRSTAQVTRHTRPEEIGAYVGEIQCMHCRISRKAAQGHTTEQCPQRQAGKREHPLYYVHERAGYNWIQWRDNDAVRARTSSMASHVVRPILSFLETMRKENAMESDIFRLTDQGTVIDWLTIMAWDLKRSLIQTRRTISPYMSDEDLHTNKVASQQIPMVWTQRHGNIPEDIGGWTNRGTLTIMDPSEIGRC